MIKRRSIATTGQVFAVVSQAPAAQSLRQRVESGGVLSLDGVAEAAQPFLAVLLAHLFPRRPVVVVTEGLKAQELFQQDIETWLADGNVGKGEERKADASRLRPLFYPAWEVLPSEGKLPHVDVISDRLETLVVLSRATAISHASAQSEASSSQTGDLRPPIVLASVTALLQKTFPTGEIGRRTRRLQCGDPIDPLDLVEWLEEQGYDAEVQVAEKGAIALRGGILDLWPLTSPWPVRLEFFGNELESLRYFDPITQISNEEIPAVTIPPGGELGILKKLQQARTDAQSEASPEELTASLLDYLPSDAIVLLCNPEAMEEQARRYAEELDANNPFFISWKDFQNEITARGMTRLDVSETEQMLEAEIFAATAALEGTDHNPAEPSTERASTPEKELQFQSLEVFRPIGERAPELHIAEAQRKEFFAQLHRWSRQGYAVHVFCNNDGERQRFEEVWWEYGLGNASQLQIHIGLLARGFLFEPAKTVVVTDAEIFGRYKVQRPRRLRSPHAQRSKSLLDINFAELQEGDYVVHLQHGIGRYIGLQIAPSAQGRKPLDHAASTASGDECLVIEYAPSDSSQPAPRLYVPVSEAHLVSKYVGAGKARPSLNTLGGTRWAKTKAQAETAVRDLAADMLSIQAARESQAGNAFPADLGWQREFESSFLYEETPDQWRAIVDTKKDMEAPKPMDRLICGDVGYGKTEVAIRAAFKAALSGKQVAILVPTTVLAQQHFNTFCERMADYPVRIELLSRFRTRRQLENVIKELAAGSVDIVIGTHRLLQKDILFKDLGLVVIDEEQRFGVLHKEKFKQLRRLVDVLTLSATPIPRTLYLALAGARDMSTIETPPQDRLPVETTVTAYDERIIRDAIQRELNRGGQVFYLHNRVFDINAVATRLNALVPHARIAVGHGQMHSDELEEVMTRFVNGEVDVLLSTTIVESGLDIPNANTIIIDRADRFGLSDLYQLRGRVGRYKHQAYAYLLLPRHAGLLADARKRISAIKQYSSLGSGFKIAMRDLEIRGAGNLLGAEQSGHITAVGFELYCQLLKQSVSALKGEKVKPRIETQVRIDFLALSPEERTGPAPAAKAGPGSRPLPGAQVPREVAVYDSEPASPPAQPKTPAGKTPAYIPLNYISESQHRIDVYRKLAQLGDLSGLQQMKRELRDRFGPLPSALEMLLSVAELKLIGSDRGVTVIETKDDKLMLTRNNDFIMIEGRFPRLTKITAAARIKEIKRLLLGL